MRLTNVANKMLHSWMRRHVGRQFLKKIRHIEREHPDQFACVDKALSDRHCELWGRFGDAVSDRWLRFHVNRTGVEDYTFCPEDVFYTRIERVLNDCNNAGYGLEEKNELFRYVPAGAEPEVVLRYVRGSFFDAQNRWASREQARQLLLAERDGVIGKSCRSSGGSGVAVYSELTPESIEKTGCVSYVVQRKIRQCEFSAKFNSPSINTIRMMTLRCPWDGRVVVCKSMMRIGVSEAVVDNMSKGGLCVCIDRDGSFDRYAYDYYGQRYEQHPVSKLRFQGLKHPGYDKMVEMASSVHSRIPSYNLLSFDLVQRDDGSICIVEINATCVGVVQLQYGFGGLFGEHTERLVDWCVAHSEFDTFKHVRTWY